VPKLGAHETDVPVATRFVSDARARHYWDSAGVLVKGYDAVLGLGEDAWDVYLLYGPEVKWDGPTPPRPDFWMHQLHLPARPGASASFLDPATFAAHADSLLQELRHRP